MSALAGTPHTVEILNRLLRTCQDGVDGYRRASEDTKEGPVRTFLAHAASEREEMASVLTNALVTLGSKPSHRGTLPAAVHRRWLDAVAAVGRDSKGILHECQRGEQETLSAFRGAMAVPLSSDVHAVVQSVFHRIRRASEALDRLTSITEPPAPASPRLAVVPNEPAASPPPKGGMVADIMNPKLLYVREGDRLSMTRAKILEFGVTAVPVLDDEHKPVGVISLRDLSRPGEPHVSTPARVVRGSASIEEGARTLASADVHRLVVVDDEGVAIGMVSAVDFIRALTGTPAHHPSPFSVF